MRFGGKVGWSDGIGEGKWTSNDNLTGCMPLGGIEGDRGMREGEIEKTRLGLGGISQSVINRGGEKECWWWE